MTPVARTVLSSALLAGLATLGGRAEAQALSVSIIHRDPSLATVRPEPGRVVEGYFSHYSFDTPGSRIGADGIGARVMWNVARTDYGATALPSRFAVGMFGEYAPKQASRNFSLGHVGVEGDMNVLQKPLFGRVLPVASLGAGMLWTNREGPEIKTVDFTIGNRSERLFALSPSVGTRIGLWRQLGLRAQVRDLMTFRDEPLNHLQLSGGLSFSY
jgi:hypothetical protein